MRRCTVLINSHYEDKLCRVVQPPINRVIWCDPPRPIWNLSPYILSDNDNDLEFPFLTVTSKLGIQFFFSFLIKKNIDKISKNKKLNVNKCNNNIFSFMLLKILIQVTLSKITNLFPWNFFMYIKIQSQIWKHCFCFMFLSMDSSKTST